MRKQKNITTKEVLNLIKQQDYCCALSGRKLTPETASLDHIIPLARGGEHAISNLWAVEHQVNAAKGTLLAEEFMAICRDVVRHQESIRHGLDDERRMS